MFDIAIFIAILKENRLVTKDIILLNGFINMEKIITVPMLKKRLKCASFFESFFAFKIP